MKLTLPGRTVQYQPLYTRLIAGTFILLSLALGYWVSSWFFLFTAFVEANLFQSALTKWCLTEDILAKFGYKRCGEQEKEDISPTAHTPGRGCSKARRLVVAFDLSNLIL